MLRAAIAAKDPIRIRDASTRLMDAYPKDAAVAQEVAAARIGEAETLLKSTSHPDHLRAKELLDEFEGKFPGAGGVPLRTLREKLRSMAKDAFTRAKEKKAAGDLTTARDELARAAALDPTVEGIRELQRELRTGYPILHVGVRQFPVNMSPATARTDSEKQAVELLFEGLLEEVPEEGGGVRYRPGAALTLPTAVPGGREFLLRAYDRDPSGRPGFDSQDVVGTLKLLGRRPDTWPAYPLPWLGTPLPKDNSSVRIPFEPNHPGHPDPRSVFTFKLLPARWLIENGKPADDPGFAEKPYGTGPFRLYSVSPPAGKGPREMVFVDNPMYGRWRDRTGLPSLREIRFIDVSKLDPVEAFRTDKLHILTDIPTADIPKYTAQGISNRVQVVTSTSNRRVHILAINLQRSYLQSKPLRQGLSMAIDREEILREVFRAGQPQFHKAMTGPYPPGSWAIPKSVGGAPQLVNRDLAVARLKAYLSGTGPKTDLELLYPEDDPQAEAACRKIKAQIEGLTKDGVDGRKLVINLKGEPMHALLTRVESEHRYELAYVPFDYPDDWHPYGLGAALDSTATNRGGRNWFSFLAKDTNSDEDDQKLGQQLMELRGYRDFAGQDRLLSKAIEAGKRFNDCVPFVPLWQLDRHTVVHNSLKIYLDDSPDPVNARLLNPTPLFQNVARWRLD
jgi:ABC-type oligopeptide transport system substrate-binding subunit